MKTLGTSLLENIISNLMEFRSIINLSGFVNYLYFLWLSDIVNFHYLFIPVTVGRTQPLMMSMNSFSCLSDTTRLLRKYHSHCLKVSLYREFFHILYLLLYLGHQCTYLKLGEFANCMYKNGRDLQCTFLH